MPGNLTRKAEQMDSLEREIERRKMDGLVRLSVADLGARYAALGYRLDRSMDCGCIARVMTGPAAGDSYPCLTTGVRDIESGLSAWNADAPRGARYRKMQALRRSAFAVTRGRILDV
jgi:hypothetical protein